MTDVHCHLLPQIDDGFIFLMEDLEQMLKKEKN